MAEAKQIGPPVRIGDYHLSTTIEPELQERDVKMIKQARCHDYRRQGWVRSFEPGKSSGAGEKISGNRMHDSLRRLHDRGLVKLEGRRYVSAS